MLSKISKNVKCVLTVEMRTHCEINTGCQDMWRLSRYALTVKINKTVDYTLAVKMRQTVEIRTGCRNIH